MKMKLKCKILLTGSSGFVGRHLHSELVKEGGKVLTFDLPSKDIRKWGDLKDVSADLVYHLAAVTYIPYSFKNPRITYETNVLGTLNVLELCRLQDIKKIVYTSSYVYGQPKYLPVDEKHPVKPTNPYTYSKLMGERLCEAYAEFYGIECVILRPFNIYGEGQGERFLIPSIFKQIFEKGAIRLENPNPRRDFLYVKDLVEAYLKAGKYNKSKFEVFNIGYGKSYSVRELVDMIMKICGRKVKVTYEGRSRKGEIADVVADTAKARKRLKWKPKTKIEDGLKRVMGSYL